MPSAWPCPNLVGAERNFYVADRRSADDWYESGKSVRFVACRASSVLVTAPGRTWHRSALSLLPQSSRDPARKPAIGYAAACACRTLLLLAPCARTARDPPAPPPSPHRITDAAPPHPELTAHPTRTPPAHPYELRSSFAPPLSPIRGTSGAGKKEPDNFRRRRLSVSDNKLEDAMDKASISGTPASGNRRQRRVSMRYAAAAPRPRGISTKCWVGEGLPC